MDGAKTPVHAEQTHTDHSEAYKLIVQDARVQLGHRRISHCATLLIKRGALSEGTSLRHQSDMCPDRAEESSPDIRSKHLNSRNHALSRTVTSERKSKQNHGNQMIYKTHITVANEWLTPDIGGRSVTPTAPHVPQM